MTELLLIRHGQANAEAADEAGYDRLSPLGYDQARWLGDWLRGTGVSYDRFIHGSLRRHRETAAGLGIVNQAEEDPRWNEISYYILSAAYEELHGRSAPDKPEDFADYFAGLMEVWAADALPGAPESHSDFTGRVLAALAEEAARGGRAVIVTSGGVIGTVVAAALGLSPDGMARLTVAIENTAMQRLAWRGGRWRLLEYGACPHLATPDRAHARTFV